MTNRKLKQQTAAKSSRRSNANYKEYLLENKDASWLQLTLMRQHDLAPCVAAYALFSTNFVGIDAAMDFVFEKFEGKM